MMDVFARAANRLRTAEHILSELDLRKKWSAFGRPVVVGAVAYALVVSPDIDMEIYCPELRIEDGFQILATCALHPNVTKARFSNELHNSDKALYWQLRYRHEDDEEWKIDMWSASEDYELPRSENLVEPMRKALTLDTRRSILELKEKRFFDLTLNCPSIYLYRAVLDEGVRIPEQLRNWLKDNQVDALTDWTPKVGTEIRNYTSKKEIECYRN